VATPQLVIVNPDMPIEITKWLQELGLEQYASAFRDHAIDAEDLERGRG